MAEGHDPPSSWGKRHRRLWWVLLVGYLIAAIGVGTLIGQARGKALDQAALDASVVIVPLWVLGAFVWPRVLRRVPERRAKIIAERERVIAERERRDHGAERSADERPPQR